jgi:2-polyprenyl-3-methyl-5-hydroxy-6-metoxy-1,4-benzoquinol methylase
VAQALIIEAGAGTCSSISKQVTTKILDVGCGGGILAESLAKEGALVTGIDMAEAGLEVAKLHLLESGLTVDYQKIPVEEFANDNAQTFVTNAPSLASDSAKIPPPQPTSRIFLPLSEPPHCFLM